MASVIVAVINLSAKTVQLVSLKGFADNMQKLKRFILSCLSWLWGLLSILIGLAWLFEGRIIGGLLILVGGLMLLPPIRIKLPVKSRPVVMISLALTFVPLLIISNQEVLRQQQDAQTVSSGTEKLDNVESQNVVIQQKKAEPVEPIQQEPVKKLEPKKTSQSKQSGNNVESHSQQMDFSSCISLQKQTADFLGGQTVLHLVNTSDLSVVKYCTTNGAVLITCSKPDEKMVTTKSDNMKGCR